MIDATGPVAASKHTPLSPVFCNSNNTLKMMPSSSFDRRQLKKAPSEISIKLKQQRQHQPRRPSLLTDSTAAESSCDTISRPRTDNTKIMSSPSNRKKKKMDKATRKMLLVKLVKNEMMSAWDGEFQEEKPSTSPPAVVPQPKSSADMFYAMMNGENVSANHTLHTPEVLRGIDGYSEYGLTSDDERTRNTFDQRSLVDLIFADDDKRSTKSPSRSPDKRMSRRVSTSSVDFSVNSLARTNSVDNFDLHSETDNDESMGSPKPSYSKSYSRRSNSSHGDSSGNGSQEMNSDSDAGISVREIEEMVMANMPKHVLDQIPKEAWSTIFGNAQAGSSYMSNEEDGMEEDDEEYLVDDDITEVSDITGPTLFKMMDNGMPSPKSKRETRWESDDAPPELVPTGWASDSLSGVDDAGVTIQRSTSNSNSNRVDFAGQVQAVTMQPTIRKDNLKVTFNTVDVRYYERILDINPAVTNGAAIGIGWRYKRGGCHPVDEWESKRGRYRRPNELVLPRHVREALLKDLGYTQQDIAAAVRVIFKAKNKRKQTVQNLGTEQVEEVVESAARRVKNILSLGMKKGLVSTKSKR